MKLPNSSKTRLQEKYPVPLYPYMVDNSCLSFDLYGCIFAMLSINTLGYQAENQFFIAKIHFNSKK